MGLVASGGKQLPCLVAGQRFAGVDRGRCLDADELGDVAEKDLFTASVFECRSERGVDVLDAAGIASVGPHGVDHEAGRRER